jgi:hypothetical protein
MATTSQKLTLMNGKKKPDRLITLDQLAAKLQRTPRTILRWRKRYDLPHFRIGGASLYDWEEFIEALRKKRGCRNDRPCDYNCGACRGACLADALPR